MKLSVIVPVFNEAATVRELLRRVLAVPLPGIDREIVIVESQSTDGSREIVQDFVHSHPNSPLTLVLEDQPRGKGHAVRTGFAKATGDVVLIQDSDLEYDVNEYMSLLEPILSGRTRFVLGSRHLSAGNWKIRKFSDKPSLSILFNVGGVLFHSLFNMIYGVRLTDPTTMFKVFRRDCIEGLHFESNRFDFDFELLGKLIRAGHLPLEIPVTYVSRGYGEGKKVRIFSDPWTWLRAIVYHRFSRLKSHNSDVAPETALDQATTL